MAIQPFAMQAQTANVMLPSEALENGARLKSLQNRNAMFEMEVQDRKAAAEEISRLNQLFQQSGGDIRKMRQGVSDFGTAMKLDKQIGENDKLTADADKSRLESGIKQLEYGSQLLQGANPDNWNDVRTQFYQMSGQDLGDYDPAKVSAIRSRGLSEKDRLKNEWDAKGYSLDVAKFGEQQRHNMTTESISQQNANKYSGSGEGGKPKNQIIYDAQGQGYVIDLNDQSLTPKPIKAGSQGSLEQESGNGSVFKKGVTTPQASEDERKAAGWLSQARLASKQMQEAMAADPTVSNKPFSESLAERIPFVKEEDINAQRSPQRQRFTAAASSFSEAALRAATGAGINETEARQKIAELTPVYGESQESIADKMARQEMYIQSLEQRAGRAAPKAETPSGKTMSMQQLQRAAADKFGGDINAARQAAQSHGYSIQ